jgi:peptidoglycan/xylan/chitin deacetylase (PgdA/CDA1 family)
MRALFALLTVLSMWSAASARAEIITIDVFFDSDRHATTGCRVASSKGDAIGVEWRLRTLVDVDTLEVTSTSYADCLATGGDAFGFETPSAAFAPPPWDVVPGEGTSGSTLIETHLPLSVFTGASMANVFVHVAGAAGNDALVSHEGGGPIAMSLSLAAVPGLAGWALMLLVLAMLSTSARMMSRPSAKPVLFGLVLVAALLGSPALHAALGDGALRSWSPNEELSADPLADAPIGVDLLGLFAFLDPAADTLWLRLDVLVGPPICLSWPLVDPGVGYICTQEPPPDQGPFGLTVALTFDDGPNPATTPTILSTLRAEGIPATFFMVGSHLGTAAERAIALDIHQDPLFRVANHSYSHPRFTMISAEEAIQQVDSTSLLIREAVEDPCYFPRYFRFPYGRADCQSMEIIRERGLSTTGVHVDTKDWCYATGGGYCDEIGVPWMAEEFRNDLVGFAVSRLLATGGGIVLMHDVHANTAAELPAIIAAFRAAGATFVSLEDEGVFPDLNANAYAPEPPACCDGVVH